MNKFLIAAAAVALTAGCNAPEAGNQAAANAPAAADGNAATPAAPARPASLGEPVTDPAKAKALMHERHERMEDIGKAMKVIGRELKSDAPDLAAVRKNADVIATLAPQARGWFPPGTEPTAGKTDSKAEIWQKPEDFLAKSLAFEQAAAAFKAAAQGNDLTAIRAAQGELGKSCKACHDLYREEH